MYILVGSAPSQLSVDKGIAYVGKPVSYVDKVSLSWIRWTPFGVVAVSSGRILHSVGAGLDGFDRF